MSKNTGKWKIFTSKKAYCFEFGSNYYELVLNLCHALFQARKYLWNDNFNELYKHASPSKSDFPLELRAFFDRPEITEDMQ